MAKFIEITPRFFNHSFDLEFDEKSSYSYGNPESVNVHNIVVFGDYFIRTSGNPEHPHISVSENYQEIKELIKKALGEL
jgi:hypothetical protein